MPQASILPRGGPAVALMVTVSAAASAVFYSHYAQVRDKAVMREGVERDKERVRMMRQKQQQQQQQSSSASSQ
ncbi:hypothetical protein FisN_9Lu099 [Fistulifera solaris]|uniref:Uncharacterized protein n=1 Tax=Fistulifera solaris TaxID=1519565 RepID=A0A1Z5KKL0_FISSO|nr:hypothetical protein FisN_9Lu099 [Fistulifera solaris]|eukprot:GAX26819.1 hypothetical protein FisN_9Lu099 [Fistulifera solaris]